MIDIGIFCRGQEGNFRDASYQSCQIWLLPEGADFPSSPFFKSQSKCLTGGELCQGADSTEMERQDIETWAGLCGEHWHLHSSLQSESLVHYQSDDNIQGPPYSLDHNHSHFILVDHSTPEERDGTTKLRLTLEKYISEQRTGYGGKQVL